MKRRASRARQGVLACIAAAVAATALVACGDEEETQTLTYTVTEQGKGTKIEGPASADTGLAEITLSNRGNGEADLQLIRVEGDHSAAETVEGLEKAMAGKPFPEWFFAGGGVGITGPGESQTVTQVLKPGTYYAFDTEGSQGPPDPKAVPALEVSGEESSDEVEGDARVTAVEYAFEAEELPSGEVEIDFENAGDEPHHLIAAPLKGDATAADVEQAIKSEKGQPPIEEDETRNTAVLEGGEGQAVTLDLKPGRYALLCFISDRQGGPPHALKGMVDEVEVE
ncbi:MAG TPA: hypothetical protein VIS95_02535 [Solirubrobacterales bacterium]